jgi:ectoine hydroxylase-related dioxygenase (phytanoyl-CoA dioxygenase family)
MLKTPHLKKPDIDHFQESGYVALKTAFSPAEAKAIQDWTAELAARPEAAGAHWVYHEESQLEAGVQLINRIENMTPYHDGLAELADALIPGVAQLLGEDAVLFKDKINFKMPGGDGFEPHQDSQAGWEAYADYFINVMVCIDAATVQNGCLQLAKREATELVGREWEPLSEAQTAAMTFEPYPTEPGDVIYFDSYAPHMSAPNVSPNMRRLYFATYNKKSEGDHLARYYADKRQSYPPDIERQAGKSYVYRV